MRVWKYQRSISSTRESALILYESHKLLLSFPRPSWRPWILRGACDARHQYMTCRLPLFESHVINPRLTCIMCICWTVIDILKLLCHSFNFKFKFISYLIQSYQLKHVSGSALALLLANSQDVAVAVKVMENLNIDMFEDFFTKVWWF